MSVKSLPTAVPLLAKSDRIDINGWMTVENRLIDDYLHQIGTAGLAIYLMICREISDKDYPSIAYMRQVCHLNTSTVTHSLKTLHTLGLLSTRDLSMIEGTAEQAELAREALKLKERDNVESNNSEHPDQPIDS